MSPTLVRLGVALATAVPMIAAVPGAAAAATLPGTEVSVVGGLAGSEDPAAHSHGATDDAHGDPVPTPASSETTVPTPTATEQAAGHAATSDTEHDMTGMEGMEGMDGDMSGHDMEGMDGDMSGHDATDHGEEADTGGHAHDESGTAGDGHDAGAPTQERPRALVLGSFGLVNGAVLVAAAVLRRRDRARPRHRPHVTSAPTTD